MLSDFALKSHLLMFSVSHLYAMLFLLLRPNPELINLLNISFPCIYNVNMFMNMWNVFANFIRLSAL